MTRFRRLRRHLPKPEQVARARLTRVAHRATPRVLAVDTARGRRRPAQPRLPPRALRRIIVTRVRKHRLERASKQPRRNTPLGVPVLLLAVVALVLRIGRARRSLPAQMRSLLLDALDIRFEQDEIAQELPLLVDVKLGNLVQLQVEKPGEDPLAGRRGGDGGGGRGRFERGGSGPVVGVGGGARGECLLLKAVDGGFELLVAAKSRGDTGVRLGLVRAHPRADLLDIVRCPLGHGVEQQRVGELHRVASLDALDGVVDVLAGWRRRRRRLLLLSERDELDVQVRLLRVK